MSPPNFFAHVQILLAEKVAIETLLQRQWHARGDPRKSHHGDVAAAAMARERRPEEDVYVSLKIRWAGGCVGSTTMIS